MFLRLDNSDEYSDNSFGHMAGGLMEGYKDLIVIFRDYIICFREDPSSKQSFIASMGKIIEVNEFGHHVIEVEVHNFEFNAFNNIGYAAMSMMREKFKNLKSVDFPVDEFRFKAVDCSADVVYEIEK